MHRNRIRNAVAVAVTAALVAACSGDDGAAPPSSSTASTSTTVAPTITEAAPTTTRPSTTTTTTATTTTTTSTTVPTRPPLPGPAGLRAVAPFADYRWVPLLDDGGTSPWPTTPTSFDDVLLVPAQQGSFDEGRGADLIAAIEREGFAIEGVGYRFFHDGYKGTTYWEHPVYVTTDALYHSWHLAFDRILRDTEQLRLLPTLEDFLAGAVDAAHDQERALAGTALADPAHRVTAYYEAAATVTGVDVGSVNDLATAEVALIEAAADIAASPITGAGTCEWPDSFVGCIDYSLFLPRGHYTRTPELRRYFAGMSVLGVEGFALADGYGVVPGLLAGRVILEDPDLLAAWRAIYEPTAFLVGLADDIDPMQLAAAADEAVPGWRDDPTLLEGGDAAAIADAVLASHPVAIDPDRAAMRVMGSRFTLDAFVLDQLAWPNVGTDDDRRGNVSALDVAAVFGSELARELQLATQARYLHYEEQLDAMTDVVGDREPDAWATTVYDAWLAALEPQFAERSTRQPDYMQTDAWAAKSLQTGLGSYTELKHDTVLYTKQGSSGEGDGPEPPTFEPVQWVEPDPVAFGRIAAAAELLRDGFAACGLLTDETEELLDALIELSSWLAGIAAGELEGDLAGGDDDARLRNIGSELEYLWILSTDLVPNEWGGFIPGWTERAGLVTDVFTTSFSYLQLATGDVDQIYVIVPIADGRFELAEGFVYSYYEFWRSNSLPRLTDEEWRALLSDPEGDRPPRPTWMEPILVTDRPIATDWYVEW